jgi:hypothetical protein
LKEAETKTTVGMRINGTTGEIPLKHLHYDVKIKNSIAQIELT